MKNKDKNASFYDQFKQKPLFGAKEKKKED